MLNSRVEALRKLERVRTLEDLLVVQGRIEQLRIFEMLPSEIDKRIEDHKLQENLDRAKREREHLTAKR